MSIIFMVWGIDHTKGVCWLDSLDSAGGVSHLPITPLLQGIKRKQ